MNFNCKPMTLLVGANPQCYLELVSCELNSESIAALKRPLTFCVHFKLLQPCQRFAFTNSHLGDILATILTPQSHIGRKKTSKFIPQRAICDSLSYLKAQFAVSTLTCQGVLFDEPSDELPTCLGVCLSPQAAGIASMSLSYLSTAELPLCLLIPEFNRELFICFSSAGCCCDLSMCCTYYRTGLLTAQPCAI